MKRGVSAALFILAATLLNLAMTAGFFVGLLLLYGLTLGRFLKVGASLPAILLSFIAAVVLSTLVYSALLKRLRSRYDLQKRFGLK